MIEKAAQISYNINGCSQCSYAEYFKDIIISERGYDCEHKRFS